jgi:hypothetical protein
MNMATKAKSKKNEKAETPEIVSQKTVEAIQTTPVEIPKKHNGHPYKEGCACAMCKRITSKNNAAAEIKTMIINEYIETNGKPLNKDEIIAEYVASLEVEDKMIFQIYPETEAKFSENIEKLKMVHGEISKSTLENVFNTAIQQYCISL